MTGTKENKWIALKVLGNRFQSVPEKELFSSLDSESLEHLENLDISSDELGEWLDQKQRLLHVMHYTWLKDPFESVPDELKPYVLGSLPDSIRLPFMEWQGLEEKKQSLPPPTRSFFKRYFANLISMEGILPISFYPKNQLRQIGQLDKETLLEIVDLIGLYDLVPEISQLIDKKRLKKVYEAFTTHQKGFLKSILHRSDKRSHKPLGIEQWSGSAEKLQKEIHKRGLQRLGHALSGQPEGICWYLLRIFDTGRAAVIQRNQNENKDPVSQAVLLQVFEAANYLKKENDKKQHPEEE